jgi:nucleotide-binding universal stress UspA family protein
MMMEIRRRTVACALAGTERDGTLAAVAAALGGRLGLGVELVHVNRLVDMAPVAAGTIAIGMPVPAPEDAAALSRERLRSVAGTLGDDHASCAVLDGAPAMVLEEVSRRPDLAYLVVGDHGAGPLRAFVENSLTRTLLRTSGCPLVVVPEHGSPESIERPTAVVCAVDEEATAPAAVATARELARRLDVTLMIRTVEEGLLDLPGDGDPFVVVAGAPRHGLAWSVFQCSLPERLLARLEAQLLVLAPGAGENR